MTFDHYIENGTMTVHRFSEFELDLNRRRLTRLGAEMRLGSRAFDILVTLVEKAGQIVDKNELIGAVWPDVHVEEGSLRVHLVALRKALRDGSEAELIQNVAGRGYRFLGDIDTSTTQTVTLSPPQFAVSNLPVAGPSLIGRARFIADVLSRPMGSITTIAGPAGVGKTAVALEIARRIEPTVDAVHFMDLAALGDQRLMSATLASLLGLAVPVDDPFTGIVNALGSRRVLLVLDNCEPFIEAAARFAERLRRSVANLTILVTSQEPMLVPGERVLHLPPLSVPSEDEVIEDAGSFTAIELLADRIALISDEDLFETPASLALAGNIVRKLDGLPLAIEFAASRATELGLEQLSLSLESPLKALRRGHRFAPPRQQTLRAALDWSFNLLLPDEQQLLGMLSIFAGHFTFEAVIAVLGEQLKRGALESALEGLILKSMLSVSIGGGRFRLLETTREYAREKVAGTGSDREVARAHAQYCRDELRAADAVWGEISTLSWQSRFGDLIHDIRLAIDWSLYRGHDPVLGIELSAASNLLWSQLGLMSEQLDIVQRALEALATLDMPMAELEMKLRTSAGSILYSAASAQGDDEAVLQFARAVEIACATDDALGYYRAAGGLSAVQTTRGEYEDAVATIQRFDALYGQVLVDVSSRVHAHNLHYMGRFQDMNAHASRAYGREANLPRRVTHGANFDLRLSLGGILSKSEWILGEVDRAVAMIEDAIDDAQALNHPISTCLFLATSACPVLFGIGDVDRGRSALALLTKLATQNSLGRWLDCAQGYAAVTDLAQADEDILATPGLAQGYPEGPLYENLLVLAGTRLPASFLERSLERHAGWCRAELYRIKGEHVGRRSAEKARALFQRGLAMAREQAALTWELRIATSLLRTPVTGSESEDRARLEAILDRFPQSLRTVDGKRAVQLLGQA